MHANRSIDVLGVGAPIVDHIAHVSDAFLAKLTGKKGGMETVDLETFSTLLSQVSNKTKMIPGGCCANTVRGLAHLGWKCALTGKIGTDAVGKQLLQRLQKLHIQPFYTHSTTPTAQVISFVTPDGERTCRAYLGACLEMTVDDLKVDFFKNVKHMHIEGYTLLYPGLTRYAMEQAKNAGALVSLDLANFQVIKSYHETLSELIRDYVDICFCNEDEIKTFTQCSTVEEGCSSLQKLCAVAVVHTRKGAWACDKKAFTFSPSFPVEKPLDTTAAGDLFASGFMHGFLAGKPLETCLKYGNLLGAATVQAEGSELSDQTWIELRKQISEFS